MNNAEKVKAHIIDPMVRFYGGAAPNAEVVDAFIEELGRFSADALDAAWKRVRAECKHRPSLAHFVEAVREATPPPSVGIAGPRERKDGYVCHRNTALANEVMRSPVGQLALKHNVACSIWMLAFRDGIRPTEADVWKQKRAWGEAVDKLATLPPNAPMRATLESFYQSFIDRETKLRAKFAA